MTGLTSPPDGKQWHSLKNRLTGDAAIYKPYLDRESLRDPLGGVNYFKDTIRPPFLSREPQVCFCGDTFIYLGFIDAKLTYGDGVHA